MTTIRVLRLPAGLSGQAVILCTSTTQPAELEPGSLISETDTGNVRMNTGTFEAPVYSSPINSASVDASAVTKGQTRLSVAAASPTAPIAVGVNDPDYTGAVAHSEESGNAHGATAADIGAVDVDDHTKAAHDDLDIDADTVDGSHAADFAPAAHVDSTDGHPLATTTDPGFMSAADKADVHERAHAIDSETDHTDIDNANKADGRVLVWRTASSAHVYEDPAAASVPPASETEAGKVELATSGETATGTDNTRAVHPAGLKALLDTLIPSGTIMEYGGFSAPSGYLLVDGTAYSRATYANLFSALTKTTSGTTTNGSATVSVTDSAGMKEGMLVEGPGIAVGTTITNVNSSVLITISASAGVAAGAGTIRALPHGQGDGSTTFNVPDGRGRALVGAGQGTSLTNRVLGAKFGAETHQLTIDELAGHDHYTSFQRLSNTPSTGGSARLTNAGTDNDIWTSWEGGDQPHNNVQPSLTINYIIKT